MATVTFAKHRHIPIINLDLFNYINIYYLLLVFIQWNVELELFHWHLERLIIIINHIYCHLDVFYLDLIIDLLIHFLQLKISTTLIINVFIFILFDLMVILGNGSEPNWMDLTITGRHLLTLMLFQHNKTKHLHLSGTSQRYNSTIINTVKYSCKK